MKRFLVLAFAAFASCSQPPLPPPVDEPPALPNKPDRLDACRALYNRDLDVCFRRRQACVSNPNKEKLYDPMDKLSKEDEDFLQLQACDGHASECRAAAFKKLETCTPPG